MLDLSLLQELGVGEHIGEGSLDFVHLAEAHGVEILATEFGVVGRGGLVGDAERSGCLASLGGGKGGGRADEGSEESRLNHGDSM